MCNKIGINPAKRKSRARYIRMFINFLSRLTVAIFENKFSLSTAYYLLLNVASTLTV